jgi:hypothetical protein
MANQANQPQIVLQQSAPAEPVPVEATVIATNKKVEEDPAATV